MIYFDNASSSFYKPKKVILAVKAALEHLPANPGRAAHSESIKSAMLVNRARSSLKDYLGLENGTVSFTANCTQALNAAIFGLSKKKGHIITTVFEHNSVLRPLDELRCRDEASVTVVSPDKGGFIKSTDIEKSIKKNSYMVIVNHISNITGAIADIHGIADLCSQKGLLLLVDGAQSVGYEDINLEKTKIDMLAVAPHKGLHGPQGVGVLACRNGIILKPIFFGGTGTDYTKDSLPQLPEGIEAGTLPVPAIAGTLASVLWTKKNEEQARKKVFSLGEFAKEELKKISGVKIYDAQNSLACIVSFSVNDLDSSLVNEILSEKYNLCLRSGLCCAPLTHKYLGTLNRGLTRASFGIDNSFFEVETLLRAVRDISRG